MVSVLEHHHDTVTVSNMDKSLEFYRDYLGLVLLSDREQSGEVYDRLYGARGVRFRGVRLETEPLREPTKRVVELIQWHSPLGKPLSLNACDQAFTWVGIPIKDLDSLYDNQPPAVYHRFLSPPVHIRPGHAVAFCRDPDGSFVELTMNNHLSINALDQDKLLAFYRDMLGLKPAPPPAAPPGGQQSPEERRKAMRIRVRTWYALPRGEVDWVNSFTESQLDAQNGRIEIGKWHYPPGKPLAKPLKLWDIGVKWPGFMVRDMEAAYQELAGKGVNFISAPVQGPRWKACICQDPEGNFVELVQRL